MDIFLTCLRKLSHGDTSRRERAKKTTPPGHSGLSLQLIRLEVEFKVRSANSTVVTTHVWSVKSSSLLRSIILSLSPSLLSTQNADLHANPQSSSQTEVESTRVLPSFSPSSRFFFSPRVLSSYGYQSTSTAFSSPCSFLERHVFESLNSGDQPHPSDSCSQA